MTTDNNIPATRDYRVLINLDRLSSWTLDRQREHGDDQATYEGALAAFQTHLRSQNVEGDGTWSARRRARKVEKHLKSMIRASKKAGASAENLRTAYAAHIAHVEALPAQRAAKADKRADRRQAAGALVTKSLHKSAQAMTPRPEQAPPAGGAGKAPAAEPVRGIGDLWRKGA